MLTLIILIPLFGALLILPMSDTLESHSQMKKIALTTSLINFLFLYFYGTNLILVLVSINLYLNLIN